MNFKSISSFASTVTSGHLIFVRIIFNKYLARLRARTRRMAPRAFEILILVLIGSEADDKKVHVRTFISPALRASFRNVLARGPDNSSGNGAIMCDK